MFLDFVPFCAENCTGDRASVYPMVFGWTYGQASVYRVQLFFPVFCRIELELIFSSIVSSSKCCFDFLELSWTEFEQVHKISKANSN